MSGYRIISADDHVIERPDLWSSRIEAKYRDQAPRVVHFDDGGDWWTWSGHKVVPVIGGIQAGTRFDHQEQLTLRGNAEAVGRGGYIPDEHLKDMEIDGIDVSIVYPTSALSMYKAPIPSDVLDAIFVTYNDWVAEFCESNPGRLKGVGIINTDDVNNGIKELERCRKIGLIGALITLYPPEDRPYASPEYEPLWAAAEDLGMPLSLHTSTNRFDPNQKVSERTAASVANIETHLIRMSLAHIIFSGVFERYPKLHVGSVEQDASWAAHFLFRLDYTYTQRPLSLTPYRFKGEMIPSDFFHRNVFIGFQEDPAAVKMRDIIGVANLQWGSDYPHMESTFPRSREILEEILADCTEEEKAKIAGENALRVYSLN